MGHQSACVNEILHKLSSCLVLLNGWASPGIFLPENHVERLRATMDIRKGRSPWPLHAHEPVGEALMTDAVAKTHGDGSMPNPSATTCRGGPVCPPPGTKTRKDGPMCPPQNLPLPDYCGADTQVRPYRPSPMAYRLGDQSRNNPYKRHPVSLRPGTKTRRGGPMCPPQNLPLPDYCGADTQVRPYKRLLWPGRPIDRPLHETQPSLPTPHAFHGACALGGIAGLFIKSFPNAPGLF